MPDLRYPTTQKARKGTKTNKIKKTQEQRAHWPNLQQVELSRTDYNYDCLID